MKGEMTGDTIKVSSISMGKSKNTMAKEKPVATS
jgi:hypothetical protein